MKDLLKYVNRIMDMEFPETDFKAELIVGKSLGVFDDAHAMVILNFTVNKERYRYRYVRVAESPSSNYIKDLNLYSDILDSLKIAFLNNIFFGVNQLHIPSLLSGEVEPLSDWLE